MVKATSLSSGDSQVLTHIFDPESAPTAGVVIDASLPADVHISDPALLSQLKARELEAIKYVERLSEGDPVDEAARHNTFLQTFQLFSLLIEEHPQYASAFNNRAQLIRWRYGDHVFVQQSKSSVNDPSSRMLETALTDLDSALRLATPRTPSNHVSPSQAKLLAQAHTQRASLLRTASKDLKERESGTQPKDGLHTSQIPPYENFTAEMFEEAGARDFFMGGRYGNEIGKAMAVHTNPYAKMCGNIVKEAMRKEFSPGVRPEVLG